ncbi:hypothetical protein BJ944DRAFT_240754 [Cunninghamella echinulata]|nr:hypothetical protein BJ944DRAFT_240754 [Cunninghamella echinulata]
MLLKASLLLFANLALSTAFYGRNDAVTELTSKNFKKEVLDNDKLVAVEFYAPWCGHCQKLAPAWKKAANNLKNFITVAAINCDEDENKPLCGQYGIQGFPTIKLFRPSVNKKGVRTKKPTDYQGPREAKPIVDHLLSLQPSNVRLIKGDAAKVKSKISISLDDFLGTDNSTLPKVILFTDKSTTSPMYKALSVDYGNGRLLMGEARKSESSVLKEFGVDKYPTLLIIPPGEDAIVYDGELKYQPLYDHLSTFALNKGSSNKNNKNNNNQKVKDEEKMDNQEPPVKPKVEELASNDKLKQHCIEAGNTICTIVIVSEDEKDENIKLLNDINDENTNTLFRFGWMTSEKASDIMKQLDLVEDFPGLFIIHPSKQLYRPYIGAWDKKNIIKWLGQISTGRVQAWSYNGELKISDRVHTPHEEEYQEQHHARDEL